MAVELAAAAVAAIVPYLAKAADKAAGKLAEQAVESGGKLLGWLRARLADRGKEALDDLEADPQSPDNQADLRKQIGKLIEAEPALRAELEGLVAQAGASGEAMVQNVSGTGAIGNQIRGSDNQVTIER
jgi:hypothetical protein